MKDKVLILCLMLAAAGIGTADAAYTFEFNPVDFFAYRDVSEGFSTDGGMFKLHETWGGNQYRSWTNDGGQRTMVDNFCAGLGAGEGIRRFNIWLANNDKAYIPQISQSISPPRNVF